MGLVGMVSAIIIIFIVADYTLTKGSILGFISMVILILAITVPVILYTDRVREQNIEHLLSGAVRPIESIELDLIYLNDEYMVVLDKEAPEVLEMENINMKLSKPIDDKIVRNKFVIKDIMGDVVVYTYNN